MFTPMNNIHRIAISDLPDRPDNFTQNPDSDKSVTIWINHSQNLTPYMQ